MQQQAVTALDDPFGDLEHQAVSLAVNWTPRVRNRS
jgi:hypothetical protein